MNTEIVWLALPDQDDPLRFNAMNIYEEDISSWSNTQLDYFHQDTIWVQSFEQLNQVKILLAIGLDKHSIEEILCQPNTN